MLWSMRYESVVFRLVLLVDFRAFYFPQIIMEPHVSPSGDHQEDSPAKCQRCNNLVKSCLRMKQIIVEGESVFKLYAQKCREIEEGKKTEMTRHWESSTEVRFYNIPRRHITLCWCLLQGCGIG